MPTKTDFSGNDKAVFNKFYEFGKPNGNILYVHSGNGSASGPGFSPEAPYSTIDAAVGACTADNNDVIVVLPGHTETVVGAAGLALDVAGITIIGIGSGRQRPKVNFTTSTAASCDISAARVSVSNLVFTCSIDAQTAMINISAADCTIQGCEIEHATAAAQATLAVLTTASADRLSFIGNFVHGSTDAGTAAALRVVGGDAIRIEDNIIVGAYTTTLGGIDNPTTAATNLVIARNLIGNQTASSTKVIVLKSDSVGFVINNRLQILSGTAPITAAAGYVGGNYYVAAAGVTAGTLV